MATATLTKGAQKTRPEYTLVCTEAQLSAIKAALWLASWNCDGNYAKGQSRGQDATLLAMYESLSDAGVETHVASGLHMIAPKRDTGVFSVTRAEVPDGPAVPDKVTLEMNREEADFVRSLIGITAGDGWAEGASVYAALRDAGAQTQRYTYESFSNPVPVLVACKRQSDDEHPAF